MKKLLFVLLLANGFSAQAQMKNAKKMPSNQTTTEQGIPSINKPSIPQAAANNALVSPLLNFKALPKPARPTLSRDLDILRDVEGDIIMVHGTKDVPTAQNRSIGQKMNDYLSALQADLGFRQMNESFELRSSDKDALGQEHFRMQQMHKGVPVYGGEIILHTQEDEFVLLNGRFFPESTISDISPTISATNAKQLIENDLRQKGVELVESNLVKEKFKAILVIYHKDRKEAERLAWHITIRPNAMARYEYFVDAKTGEVIHQFNHTCNFVGDICAHHADNEEVMDGSADASAADLFGVKRDLKSYLTKGSYYLIDVSRPMYQAAQSTMPDEPVGAILTLDAFNTSPEKSSFKYDNVTSLDNKWSGKAGAISAHYNAGLAYNYFKNVFGRESINGKGGTIVGLVNVAEKNGGSMENAFWNGEAMFYGNGGSAFFPLARGLDVAGHEMSHGVIQNTANLEYEGESGAMNESFADIFGAMIDRDDWKIGEDVVKTAVFPSGALRDLSNPNNGGTSINDNSWQPKHFSERYTGTGDNGGVHINSGIPNFAFYKYATAITKDKAEKVFFRALEKYLVKSSKFIDLRASVTQAATDLYGAGTKEVTEVANAFAAVGIGGGGSSTGSGYQTNVGVNPGSDIVGYTDKNYTNVSAYLPATKKTVKISERDINSRPSVTDDGSYMVFVGADKKIYGVICDWAKGTFTEELIGANTIWRNAVISKDGNRLAAVKDVAENIIYVYDFTKNPSTSKAFTLTNPTFTTGVATGDVQNSDAMEFDITGENIMYDAFNVIKGTTGNIEYWDIGFLRAYDNKAKIFGDGKIGKLFSNLEEGTSVGNPTFSKNSPHIVTFDYQDEFDQIKTYILTANLQTGDVGEIYYNGKDRLGFPTFSRLDDKILFETTDALGDFAATIDLNADKLSAKTTKPAEVVDAAFFPFWFSNGTRVLVGTTEVANEVFNVFPNPFDESLTLVFKDAFAKKEYQVFDLTGKILLSGTADNEQVILDLSFLPKGAYVLKVGAAVQKIVKF